MKNSLARRKREIRKRIIAASIAGCVTLPVASVQASFLSNLFHAINNVAFHAITDPVTDFLNQQRELLNIAMTGNVSWNNLANVVLVDYQHLQDIGFSLLSPLGGCDLNAVSTPYGPINTYCFSGVDVGDIQQGVNRLSAYAGNMNFNGQSISPIRYTVQYTTSFFDLSAPTMYQYLVPELRRGCADISEIWGCHYGVTTLNGYAAPSGLSPALMIQKPVIIAGVLLHESHHSVYGGHTNGAGADSDCLGPYAMEAMFLIDAARGAIAGLDSSEKYDANTRASYLATGTANDGTRIVPEACGNAILARTGSTNAPIPLSPVGVCLIDESGQEVCTVRVAAASFTPPPPPSPADSTQCFIDESGHQVCI